MYEDDYDEFYGEDFYDLYDPFEGGEE